jgi:inositol transport system ATP-binding protein
MNVPTDTPREVLLRINGVSKAFGEVPALQDVSLTIRSAEVHALMGENGAGKSTLMKIVAGLHESDAGEILLDGKPANIESPHDALKSGIAMIHQELMPFPDMTVAENIFVGQEPVSNFLGWIDRGKMTTGANELLARVGAPVQPSQRMRELSVATMQAVEIAKAISHRARLLIMDEPTSATSLREVDSLFRVIADLKSQGVAIIYISHKLDEVFRIADTITVLRDGRHIATRPAGELDENQLIALMVGRDLRTPSSAPSSTNPEAALSVRNLSRAGKFQDISFDVRPGEILGIAGLMGAGRTEIMHAIYGLDPADSGEILVRGERAAIKTPRDAITLGIAMVGEDRKDTGLVLNMSVKHNVTLAALREFCSGGFVRRSRENDAADRSIQTLSIKTSGRDQRVDSLSGGNQQKVVIARALLTQPKILILDEPTRGIDIAAKVEVYEIIQRLAGAGVAVIVVSSELPEVLSLSHRILVLREGRIAAKLDPKTATQEKILQFAMPRE